MAVDTSHSRGEEEREEEEDLWSAILNDVATSSARNRQHVTKTLLVLGDVSSGKSTLVDKLCHLAKSYPIGGKFPLSGCSLEYRFIDVEDEETEDLIDRMGVWILDGVVWHSQLLSFVLKREVLSHTLVMIVVDMSQPWTIMESLERWAQVVKKHISSLMIPPKQMKDMEEKLVKQFQSYTDPEDTSISSSSVDDGVALPLGETTLTCNLGVPLVVVCCKSDAVTDLEKNHSYKDEHLDFIQQHIRKFCLSYGAALVYTSTKEERNLSLLHKYLLHRAYGFPFKDPAWVVDKDAIFVPSGWDNEKKIGILYEHMKQLDPNAPFESIIVPPKPVQPESEAGEELAEEDQIFLMAQQAHIAKSPKPTASPAGVKPTTPTSASKQASTKEKAVPTAGETVLANFFNNLLNKRQPGSSRPMRSSARAEAAAELEKMKS